MPPSAFRACLSVPRSLDGLQGDTAQENQKQQCDYKGAAPSPVLNDSRVALAASEIDPKLTKRPQISVEKKARAAPD
jgi:hypothetical protein